MPIVNILPSLDGHFVLQIYALGHVSVFVHVTDLHIEPVRADRELIDAVAACSRAGRSVKIEHLGETGWRIDGRAVDRAGLLAALLS